MSEKTVYSNHVFDEPDIIIWDDNIPRCGYCESELEDKQRICGICGHRLDWRKK